MYRVGAIENTVEVEMNIFLLLAYKFADADTRIKIDEDSARFLKWDSVGSKAGPLKRFKMCCRQQQFRDVLGFRLRQTGFISRVFGKIGFLISPKDKTVEIGGNIDGGLMISHSFSVVFVQSAGKNLRIGPGVVIGRVGGGFPKIGNNVYIAANSTVIGDIVIGDNVIVGAGSVVTKDIPSNVVVVGNPAKVIRSITEEDYNEIM